MSFNAPRREEYDGAKIIYLSFMDNTFLFEKKIVIDKTGSFDLKEITHLQHRDLNWDSHLVGHVEKPWNASPPAWTHSRLGESWIYNEGMRSCLRNAELREGCAAGTTSSVARRWPISSQQLKCDWLAPCLLSTVHWYSLLCFVILRKQWFSLENN